MKPFAIAALMLAVAGCQVSAWHRSAPSGAPGHQDPASTQRSEEAARKLRGTQEGRTKPNELPGKWNDLLRTFSVQESLRLIAILESDVDGYRLEIQAAELSGKIEALVERIETKMERLHEINTAIGLLEELKTTDASQKAADLRGRAREIKAEAEKFSNEKLRLEAERTALEAKAAGRADEAKKLLVAHVIVLRQAKLDRKK